ncbi:GPP34 family phosphoprotein [Actinoplanes sp. NPDC051851]|uniref:GOLPH3/VPS74 family protein n=1 Tax=Actinoplanes sp. NPDC051851 TaxID=3154753 RepID=UPI00344274D0
MTYANDARAATGARHRAPLPLHAELYLIAHDDDTGRLHINEQVLAIGLAGALLLELTFARRVEIGWEYNEFTREWMPAPGRLFITEPVPRGGQAAPTGSPLLDAALASVDQLARAQPRGEHLRSWLGDFSSSQLYHRTQASMITASLIRRAQLRRLGGLRKTDTNLVVDIGYPVGARHRVKTAVSYYENPSPAAHPPDDSCVALCGLTAALELTPFLYRNQADRELAQWLGYVVDQRNNTAITTVVQAVDAGRGDVAVAAMG